MTDAYFVSDRRKWAEIMVLHNLRFVIAQSGRYFVRGEDRVDIAGRMICGLEKAADRYDPEEGVRFLTFAGYYMKAEVRDVVNAKSLSVKANNATMAILDKRVAGNKKDESAATVADFVGNFQSPDYETVDPGSEFRRDFERIEFEHLIDHICGVLGEMPVYGTAGYEYLANGLKLTRSGLSRLIRIFRLRFLDMLSLDAIAAQEKCDRYSILATLKKALDYLRGEIVQNHGSVAELKDFFSRSGLDYAVKPDQEEDESESQFSRETVISAKADVRVLDTVSDSCSEEEEVSGTVDENGGLDDSAPESGGTSSVLNPDDSHKKTKATLVIKDGGSGGIGYRIVHDSENEGVGYTASMFARDQVDEESASLDSLVGKTRTVYRDSGFFDEDEPVQDKAHRCRISSHPSPEKPGDGFDVERARAITNDSALSLYGHRGENSGHDVTPNYERFVIQRSRRRKLTMRCYPFYGNFYSEWRRWQNMKRSRRLLYGDRVLQLIEGGVVRKEQCFRLRDGDIACYI